MANLSDLLKSVNALYGVTTNTTNVDPWNQMVQFEDDPNKVASGDTTIAFSGPPVFSRVPSTNGSGGDITQFLVPIGALQGFNDNSTNGIAQFSEIGSRLKRAARGQGTYPLSIQRVLSHHSNILYACYAWLASPGAVALGINTDLEFRVFPGETKRPDKVAGNSPHLTTFESELFGLPFGMLLATVSGDGTVISQEYWERIFVMNHGKQVGAGQPLIQEGISMVASRKVPADGITIDMSKSLQVYGSLAGPSDTLT